MRGDSIYETDELAGTPAQVPRYTVRPADIVIGGQDADETEIDEAPEPETETTDPVADHAGAVATLNAVAGGGHEAEDSELPTDHGADADETATGPEPLAGGPPEEPPVTPGGRVGFPDDPRRDDMPWEQEGLPPRRPGIFREEMDAALDALNAARQPAEPAELTEVPVPAQQILEDHPETAEMVELGGDATPTEPVDKAYKGYLTGLQHPNNPALEALLDPELDAHGFVPRAYSQVPRQPGTTDQEEMIRFWKGLSGYHEFDGLSGEYMNQDELREFITNVEVREALQILPPDVEINEAALREEIAANLDLTGVVGATFTIRHHHPSGAAFDVDVRDAVRFSEDGTIVDRWAFRVRNPMREGPLPPDAWPDEIPDLEPHVEMHAEGETRLAVNRGIDDAEQAALVDGAVAALGEDRTIDTTQMERVNYSETSISMHRRMMENDGGETPPMREYYTDGENYFVKRVPYVEGRPDLREGLNEVRLAQDVAAVVASPQVQALAQEWGFERARFAHALAAGRDADGTEDIVYPFVKGAVDASQLDDDYLIHLDALMDELSLVFKEAGLWAIDLTREQVMIRFDEHGNPKELIVKDIEAFRRRVRN